MDQDDFITYPEMTDFPELKSNQNLMGIVDGGNVVPFLSAEDKLSEFRNKWLEKPELAFERARSVARYLHMRRCPIGADVTQIGGQTFRRFDPSKPYKDRT